VIGELANQKFDTQDKKKQKREKTKNEKKRKQKQKTGRGDSGGKHAMQVALAGYRVQ